MICSELRQLHQLSLRQDWTLGPFDLVRLVCLECGVQENCPAASVDEFEADGLDEARESFAN